jgi:hypothetical protein
VADRAHIYMRLGSLKLLLRHLLILPIKHAWASRTDQRN